MTAFANRMDGVTGSAIRDLFKLMGDPEIISFGGGNPAKESFPVETVERITAEALRRDGVNLLQYGATEGYMPLREAYLEHMAAPRGLSGTADEVLITTGSMQGLDLACKIFLNPGDAVLVESPTFLGALQAFSIYQADKVPVPMDNEGVIPDALEELMRTVRPKLFYCIPTFQNPTGRTLGTERRRKIAELAEKYDVMVLEDDPYCDLRYTGSPLPPIKTFDRSGHVILLSSFSKILSPGMRLGCALATPEIIRKMTVCKQCTDTHTTLLTQAVAAQFLNEGLLPGHLKAILPGYAEKLRVMLESMDEFFPSGVKYQKPDGGLFVWGELPEGADVLPLLKRATSDPEYKVAYIPGEHFFVDGSGKNTFRLNFSSETPERLRAGMERLGRLFRENL